MLTYLSSIIFCQTCIYELSSGQHNIKLNVVCSLLEIINNSTEVSPYCWSLLTPKWLSGGSTKLCDKSQQINCVW